MKLFTITIDTEADCSADWTGAVPESYQNLTSLSERLLPVTRKFGAPATLLLNGDILQRDDASRVCERLAQEAGWELGTHLHGEFVPPHQQYESPAGIRLRDFQCGYEPEVELAKMEVLTSLFHERFGYRPTSFRAGRFGAGRVTFEACLRLGYEVDTSVVPGALLEEGNALADFRPYDHKPFVIAKGDGKSLLEIPVTVRRGVMLPPSSALRGSGSLERRFPSKVRKFLARARYGLDCLSGPLHRPSWLRPSYSSEAAMIGLLRWLSESGSQHPIVANMMFHSNELLAGASPYNATDASVTAFVERISATLAAAQALGFQCVTLSEAARSIKQAMPC